MKIIALVAASAVLISGHRSLQERPFDQPTLKEVSVNGTTIRYVELGRGAPVIFVHGAISDHRYWEPQREAVAKRYRFIAIDRRYFGAAPWPDTDVRISVDTDADDLAAFIRALKIGPAVLVGTSAGANVVLITALRYPKLARALFVHEPGLRSIVTDSADRRLVSEADADRPARAAAAAGNMADAARLFVDRNRRPGSGAGRRAERAGGVRPLSDDAKGNVHHERASVNRARAPRAVRAHYLRATGPDTRAGDDNRGSADGPWPQNHGRGGAAMHTAVAARHDPKRAPRGAERESVGVQRCLARVPRANMRRRWVSGNI